jgi:hypothetical protein
MKQQAKSQQLDGKTELLAFCHIRGGVAERSNATGCKLADGAQNIVRGFESLPRRQNCNYTPAEALTSTGAEIRTAEAVRTFQAKYGAFGCESQGDSTRDVPFLQNRSCEGR